MTTSRKTKNRKMRADKKQARRRQRCSLRSLRDVAASPPRRRKMGANGGQIKSSVAARCHSLDGMMHFMCAAMCNVRLGARGFGCLCATVRRD